MEITEDELKFSEVFLPGRHKKTNKVLQNDLRFAYYTSAETAMKIIQNGELWFRNATVMNDFSEISYGLELITDVFSGPSGELFRDAVNSIFSGTIDSVEEGLNGWIDDWKLETYLACISLHRKDEDKSGRLSMWRAYGNTALVIRNTPLVAVTDRLSVFSLPVMYFSQEDYSRRIKKVTDRIIQNQRYLKSRGQENLINSIHQMLFETAVGTKHPGFSEEREWRLYYRPNERQSNSMKPRTVILEGVPQKIYTLRLEHDPSSGLFGADIPSLIDRIIVGPTEFPYVSVKAFQDLLKSVGVEDSRAKVIASDIPLRSR